jgi:hypothetical protein
MSSKVETSLNISVSNTPSKGEIKRDSSTSVGMTLGLPNKIDDRSGPAADGQINRPTTNGAVFDQRLLGLGSVDLQWERLSAMRTGDFCFDD